MEPEAVQQSTQETEGTKPKNFFNCLAGTYFSPGDTFREIGRSPAVLIPIIVLVVLGLLQGYYLSTKMDLQSMLANSPAAQQQQAKLTPEQQERVAQQQAAIGKFIGIAITVSSGVGNLFFVLLIAAVFKLISKLIGAENRFKAVFAVTAYVIIAVSIVSFLLMVLVIYLKQPTDLNPTNVRSVVSSNLGAVIEGIFGEDALPKYFMKLFGFVDVFAIWYIALLSIGYAAISRKLKTSTVAIWISCIYGIIALIGAAFPSRVS